jgi:hypothetical protein
MLINDEILELLNEIYLKMPEDVNCVPLKDVPLLNNFYMFKGEKPLIVIFSFYDEINRVEVYIGKNL